MDVIRKVGDLIKVYLKNGDDLLLVEGKYVVINGILLLYWYWMKLKILLGFDWILNLKLDVIFV